MSVGTDTTTIVRTRNAVGNRIERAVLKRAYVSFDNNRNCIRLFVNLQNCSTYFVEVSHSTIDWSLLSTLFAYTALHVVI
jgi:hypothetical protein